MTSTTGSVRRYRLWKSFIQPAGLALVLVILLAGSAIASGPAGGAVVRPDPLVSAVAVGQHVVVKLYVQDVQELYAADVRLVFDPALLQVEDENPTTAGVQILPLGEFLKPNFVARNKACNGIVAGDPECATAGVIRYAVTQVNPSPPASGSGPLAAIRFRRLNPGTATLTFISQELSDRFGVVIPATTQSGSIETAVIRRVYLPLVFR